MSLTSSILIGFAAFLFAGFVVLADNPIKRKFDLYRLWWAETVKQTRADKRLGAVPSFQIVAVAAMSIAFLLSGNPALVAPLGMVVAMPPLLILRFRANRRSALASQLPNFLIALADALTTVPNLGQALRSTCEHLNSPMRDEIGETLAQTRVGRSLDEALESMAKRLKVPGLEPAISAALLGRRTGGDLSAILRRIATALREMARLEGVIKTKTAEGRNQAIAMGIMPILLVLVLEKIDPEWLAPLWSDPAGWVIVGAAAFLEVTAVALIRHITAVNI
jgi:tight adherence protein B